MSDYAVVNPATGETLATYPTITDDAELEQALAAADAAVPGCGATHPGRRARGAASAASPSCTASAATSSPRSSCARWASRSRPPSGEVDFAADITEFYADNAEQIMKRPADRHPRARAPRSSAARRSACCWASCRGTSRTTRSPASPPRTSLIGNTILLKHAPQCPESSAAIETIYRDAGFPEGAYTNLYVTNEQAADGHRRPARAGRLGDRFGARRCGRRRGRRAQPQEGRARAGRIRPVHPAVDRRPRRRRAGRRRRPPRQHRAVVQRRQALHRRRRASTTPFLEKFTARDERREGRRPVRRGHRARPAVVGHGRRAPRRSRSTRPSRRARRSSPAARATAPSTRAPS